MPDEVELQSVRLSSPVVRTLTKDVAYTEEVVVTAKGSVTVAWKGDRTKPAMVTYHDLGLNHVSNFQAFFNYPGVAEILPYFCVFHINAPGQEEGAEKLADDFVYPSMDELAEQVNEVINHFAVVTYVGIGVGLGANVLIRHAAQYPERVDSLLLINATCSAPGWIEWGYQKRNVNHLRQHGVTQAVLDYLVWHHFGDYAEDRAHDLVHMYKNYFNNDIQASNLAKLTEQFIWRTGLNLQRENNIEERGDASTLKVPVLNMVGAYSPFVEETVVLNGKLNPANTNWMKIQDAAMVLEETPETVSVAFRLFLQGRGYILRLRQLSNLTPME